MPAVTGSPVTSPTSRQYRRRLGSRSAVELAESATRKPRVSRVPWRGVVEHAQRRVPPGEGGEFDVERGAFPRDDLGQRPLPRQHRADRGEPEAQCAQPTYLIEARDIGLGEAAMAARAPPDVENALVAVEPDGAHG